MVSWFSEGRCIGAGHDLRPGEIVSRILSSRFRLTPRIANEQLVRRRVTPQSRSAPASGFSSASSSASRVPHLGYAGETSSDASFYRTVLAGAGFQGDTRCRSGEPHRADAL